MLRMFRELKGSYRYIVLIFALLFGQAFCDLALPSYTSEPCNPFFTVLHQHCL